MRRIFVLTALFAALTAATAAQSLKPDNPYPLNAGINQGTADSFVGAHYWYFYANPGEVKVTVRLGSAKTALGASINTTLTVTLTDAAGTWKPAVKFLGNRSNLLQATYGGKIAKRTKILL